MTIEHTHDTLEEGDVGNDSRDCAHHEPATERRRFGQEDEVVSPRWGIGDKLIPSLDELVDAEGVDGTRYNADAEIEFGDAADGTGGGFELVEAPNVLGEMVS